MYQSSIDQLEMNGGKLILNFMNTVGWHGSDHPVEWFNSYGDIIRWSERAELLSERGADQLIQHWQKNPARGESAYQQIISTREAYYRIFRALLNGESVASPDLKILDLAVKQAYTKRFLYARHSKIQWHWEDEGEDLTRPLWQIALEMSDLLTSAEFGRIHLCANNDCGWLFYDQSKNQSRKWCASQDCGNRDRVKRHNARKHQKQTIHSEAL